MDKRITTLSLRTSPRRPGADSGEVNSPIPRVATEPLFPVPVMRGPRYKWVMVALLVGVGAFNYCDRAAISSVLPLVRADLGMSNLELAGIGSFFLWAYALASPLGGLLADRESRSRIIVWSLAGESVLTLATGLVTGGAFAGYIGNHFGWRVGFVSLGVAGLLLAVAAQCLLHDSAPVAARRVRAPSAPVIAGIGELIRTPSCLIIILAGVVSAAGNNIFMNWFPLYFAETYRMSLPRASFAGTFVLYGAGMVGLITGSLFSDRIGGRRPRRRMVIAFVSTFLATPFLAVFVSPRPGLILLNACIFLFSFLLNFGDSNTSPLICDLLPPKLRSTAFGFQNSANCVAGGIGVMLARHRGFLGALPDGTGAAGRVDRPFRGGRLRGGRLRGGRIHGPGLRRFARPFSYRRPGVGDAAPDGAAALQPLCHAVREEDRRPIAPIRLSRRHPLPRPGPPGPR